MVDESHLTIPQVGGMYRGDRARKKTLVEHGFRLPSALDNRPLAFQRVYRQTRPSTLRLRYSLPEFELEQCAGGGGGTDHPPHGPFRSQSGSPSSRTPSGRYADGSEKNGATGGFRES